MKSAFNSDCYEVNRVKSPLHDNPNLLSVNELAGKGLCQCYSLNSAF